MKAISLHEPWASCIMWGWKTIETRLHQKLKSLVNQKIIIHVTKNKSFIKDADTILEIMGYLGTKQKDEFARYLNSDHFEKTFGRLIGTVEVIDFARLNKNNSKDALIDCRYENRYGLFLRYPKFFINPALYKGSQGIFNIPMEIFQTLEYKLSRKDL